MDVKIDGKLLRRYRKKKKMSQESLANEVDVSHVTVHKWEQGDIPKRWKQYSAVCTALGIEPSDLLSRAAKDVYSWLLVSYEEALIDGKPIEIARLSAQVLNWERFFNTGRFGEDDLTDEEIAHSNETERELAEMMRGR